MLAHDAMLPCSLAAAPAGSAPHPSTLTGDSAWIVIAMIAGVALLVFSLRRRGERLTEREGEGLERLEAIRREVRERYPRLARPSSDAPATTAAELEELAERLAARLDERAARLERLLAEADRRIRALESPAPAADPVPPPARTATTADPLHARVRELADRGMTPVDIARTLDIPTGQVQLILNLRRVPSAL